MEVDQIWREIALHGDLKARFGGPFNLVVSSPAETVRALCSQLSGFREAIFDGEYRVIVRDNEIDEDGLHLGFGDAPGMDIVPVPEGAKNKGAGKVILGAAIIAAAFVAAPTLASLGPGALAGPTSAAKVAATTGLSATAFTVGSTSITFANIALFGVSTLVGGISQLLTPQPSVSNFGSAESAESRPGFLFSGAVNTTEQGGPVPLVFGEIITGSQVVSAGISAERL